MARKSIAHHTDPIEYHDTMLALSEARAAQWLLRFLNGGEYNNILEDTEGTETVEWLNHWAIDALSRSLDDAEAAFRKAMAAAPTGGVGPKQVA